MTQAKAPSAKNAPPQSMGCVLSTSLHRIRRGRAIAFTSEKPEPDPAPKPGTSRAAQMLALAHDLQRLIDEGEVPDRATLAAQVGLTRARVTQLLDLLLLAPDIQDAVLTLRVGRCGGEAREEITERQLRSLVHHSGWGAQRRRWAEITLGP